MVDTLGGRRVDLVKTDNGLKITFHPISKNAKHPDAKVFQIVLSRSDLDMLKKAF